MKSPSCPPGQGSPWGASNFQQPAEFDVWLCVPTGAWKAAKPSSFESSMFGYEFNQRRERTQRLQSLMFTYAFIRSLEGIDLSSSLQSLLVTISTSAWRASSYPAACRV